MTQLVNKFIAPDSVTGYNVRLNNEQALRARNQANTADVEMFKLDTSNNLDFLKLPQADASLAIPSLPKQFATIEYITNFVLGKQDAKDSVIALADVNVTLTGSTPLVIDGITAIDTGRYGLTGQTTASENGIYTASISGGSYTLTRSADADENSEVTQGLYFKVASGTLYSGYEALLTTVNPIVVGTTNLTFAKYPGAITLVAGDMMSKSGDTLFVDIASLSGLESSNPGNVNGQLRVRADDSSLEKDKTTKISGSGSVVSTKPRKLTLTLTATDISNQYVDLPQVASDSSISFYVAGGGVQYEGDDYSVNYTGGASSKTRVTFAGGLATAGVSALASGDKVCISYTSFS